MHVDHYSVRKHGALIIPQHEQQQLAAHVFCKEEMIEAAVGGRGSQATFIILFLLLACGSKIFRALIDGIIHLVIRSTDEGKRGESTNQD
jgi:hypothetical protein